ncbi:MAG: type II toxin-antitoxin system HicA family toxin [Planctomycetia bacterium]|nr:type II toxin-antitoxin system HicA family toxin [Planctomycetia bacterium]
MTIVEVEKIFRKKGCIEIPGTKHRKFLCPNGKITCLPRHKGDIPPGTLRAIERQSGIKLK